MPMLGCLWLVSSLLAAPCVQALTHQSKQPQEGIQKNGGGADLALLSDSEASPREPIQTPKCPASNSEYVNGPLSLQAHWGSGNLSSLLSGHAQERFCH